MLRWSMKGAAVEPAKTSYDVCHSCNETLFVRSNLIRSETVEHESNWNSRPMTMGNTSGESKRWHKVAPKPYCQQHQPCLQLPARLATAAFCFFYFFLFFFRPLGLSCLFWQLTITRFAATGWRITPHLRRYPLPGAACRGFSLGRPPPETHREGNEERASDTISLFADNFRRTKSTLHVGGKSSQLNSIIK